MKKTQERLKTVNAYEARQRLGELLEEVFYKQDRVLIKRGKKPMAVVISPQEYAAYLKQRQEALQVFEDIWEKTAKLPGEKVERDVQEAVKAVRREYAQGRPRH